MKSPRHSYLFAWNKFWFEFHQPLAFALARIQVALVMLWLYIVRQLSNLQDFTDASPVSRDMALLLFPKTHRPPFAWFIFWPDSAGPYIHALFLISLGAVLCGFATRFWGVLAWVLHMGFLQRNFSIAFGADLMAGLSLFYLCGIQCDEFYSFKSVFKKKSSPSASSQLSSCFARLWQTQWLIIYAYTGFEKLKGASWWDGTALWTVLGNAQMVGRDLSFMRHLHPLIAGLTFATVLFEIYFPAALLNPSLRRIWLGAGVIFHSVIGALMGLWTFSLLMMAPYWLFLTESELDGLLKWPRFLSHSGISWIRSFSKRDSRI